MIALLRNRPFRAALAVLTLALFFGVGSDLISDASGYGRVSPRFFPVIVAGLLVITGITLLLESLMAQGNQSEQEPAALLPFMLVLLGIALDVALMRPGGFIVASTVLFACVSRAFGSANLLRDSAIGAALATTTFLLFTGPLKLNLPGGWLWGLN